MRSKNIFFPMLGLESTRESERATVPLLGWLQSWWESWVGPSVGRPLWEGVSAADLLNVAVVLLVVWGLGALLGGFLHRWSRRRSSGPRAWQAGAVAACSRPLQVLLWLGGGFVALSLLRGPEEGLWAELVGALWRGLSVAALGAWAWLLWRVTAALEVGLQQLSRKSATLWDDVLLGVLGRGLRVLAPVLGALWALPLAGFPPAVSDWVRTGSGLVLIGAIGWFLIQAVQIAQQMVLSRFDITQPDNLAARKVHTQVKVLARVLYVLIGLLTIASALMLFEEVRRLGTTLLASAGVVGIILGFAAQRTVANLFAGFQLALTQPIRVDDVVIVEGEWGRIEEITLTYVVVRIWDDRRLIVPLSYFIERPFQNWTRTSAEILGSVFVWTDYTVPVHELRDAVRKIVDSCPDWDRRFWNLQVTDATDRAVQLRVLATAADASKAWNLRCEIREKLIAHLQTHYPHCLPRVRAVLEPASAAPSAVRTASETPTAA